MPSPVLTWLKKLAGGAATPPARAVPATAAGRAAQKHRLEQSVQGNLRESCLYNLHTGPEWLEEKLETGSAADGQPFRQRTWYYPWGAVRRQLTQHGDESTLLVYFANGELKLRKHTTAGHLTAYFRWAAPEGQYTYTEQMPRYPGGDQAQLMRDVQQAFQYPAQALRHGEQGRLVLSFAVSETGLVEDIRVVSSVSPSLDEAGRQAVAAVGTRRWRPGLQNQRAVRVVFTVPITCRTH